MKVTIEFDTETKKLSVQEDGAEMADIDYVSFYKDCCYDYDTHDRFTMSISQRGKKVNGVTKSIHTMAKLFGYEDEN